MGATVAEHKTLAAALAAFQADLPTIDKGQTATVQMKEGGKYSYSYADLEDVSAVVLPLIAKHGLSFSSRPTFDGDRFVLAYALIHTSGEREEGTYPLPNAQPQQVGSAITYARRYCLCAVTGVAPGGDDDDGRAAQQSQPASKGKRAGSQGNGGPVCARCGGGLVGVPVAKVDGKFVHKDGCSGSVAEDEYGDAPVDVCDVCGEPEDGHTHDAPKDTQEGSGQPAPSEADPASPPDGGTGEVGRQDAQPPSSAGDGPSSPSSPELPAWRQLAEAEGVSDRQLLIALNMDGVWPSNDQAAKPTRTAGLDSVADRHEGLYERTILKVAEGQRQKEAADA